MVSKSLIFAAPGKDKRRKVRLNERIFLLSTFVGEAQTSEVSLQENSFFSVKHHEDSRMQRTAVKRSGVSISFIRVQKPRDSLESR